MKLSELKIKRTDSARKQITSFLREAILSGDLPEGSHLPPTLELSRRWGTTTSNAHHALSTLVKEGLVSRTPRIGTIINKTDRKLKTVAIYFRLDKWADMSSFRGLMLDLLEAELRGRGIDIVTLNDTSGEVGFKQLEHLAATRRIQAVIAPRESYDLLHKLATLPVPFACLTDRERVNCVNGLDDSLVDKAIEGLRAQGCRKAGLLSSMAEVNETSHNRFFERFRKAAKASGIEVRDEWMRIAPICLKALSPSDYFRFAYQGFRELWTQPERPDGLFVYTDDLFHGVLFAVAEFGIRVPDDLKLVFHRNQELSVFCPLPCAFVENSVALLAKRLVDNVEELFLGRKPKQGKNQYELRFHQGERNA